MDQAERSGLPAGGGRFARKRGLHRLLIKLFREVGIISAIRCLAHKRKYARLYKVYGFDHWHATAPYWCRRYKREAVRMANAVAPSVVVEVGCGLGEVIRRIQAASRHGVDRDERVLQAARVLAPDVEFIHGTFQELGHLGGGAVIDVLVVLNWLDGLSADTVLRLFARHLPRVRYLLLDEVECPKENQIGHDFAAVFKHHADLVATSSKDSDHRLVLLQVRSAADLGGRNG